MKFGILNKFFELFKFFFKGDVVKSGKFEELVVRNRVKFLFYIRMRLGEFDFLEMNFYLFVNLFVI